MLHLAAAIACSLIETAKFNGIDPQAWLTNIRRRIVDPGDLVPGDPPEHQARPSGDAY